MVTPQQAFIQFCLDHQVLRFGEFTLKSGRVSPYFFNAGLFDHGLALASLGRFYADRLVAAGVEFDLLFGPAYKGIPLVAAVAMALAEHHQRDYPFAFNRKEAKSHGEGGDLVGAPLRGRVMIVDDVMTAGTAVREVLERLRVAGAQPAGVVVSLDRQERGQGSLSAIAEIEQDYHIPVLNLINMDDIQAFVAQESAWSAFLPSITAYRRVYGA